MLYSTESAWKKNLLKEKIFRMLQVPLNRRLEGKPSLCHNPGDNCQSPYKTMSCFLVSSVQEDPVLNHYSFQALQAFFQLTTLKQMNTPHTSNT